MTKKCAIALNAQRKRRFAKDTVVLRLRSGHKHTIRVSVLDYAAGKFLFVLFLDGVGVATGWATDVSRVPVALDIRR